MTLLDAPIETDASDRNSRTPRISGYGEAKGASTPEYSIARRWSRVKVERSISGGASSERWERGQRVGSDQVRSGRVESSRPPRLMLVAVATTPAVTDIYTIVAIASHIPLQANARPRPLPPPASLLPRLSFSVRPSDFLGRPRLRAAVPPLPPSRFLASSSFAAPLIASRAALTISCALGHLLSYLEKRPDARRAIRRWFRVRARRERKERRAPPERAPPPRLRPSASNETRRDETRSGSGSRLCGERAGLSRFVRSSGCLVSP